MALAVVALAVPLAAHPGAKPGMAVESTAQKEEVATESLKAQSTGLTLKDVADNAEWRAKAAKSLN